MSSEEVTQTYFSSIPKITYEGIQSRNPLAFRYYNANEVVLGRPMKDWLRFSIAYWHSWRGYGLDMFGPGTFVRPWDGGQELDEALRRVEVNFEFLQKIGIEYFCFHDRDIAPKGKTISETNSNLDKVVSLIRKKCEQTGIKVLWGTANLFSDPRYMNGAATNPDPEVFAIAAAQVKKCLQVSHLLGAENYVFWGGREGYFTLLNTDMKQELDHLATFLRLAVEEKNRIGFKGQFLIEPKPREPTKHQYDFDSATVIGFLKNYNLDKDFKLNIEANHASLAGHTFEHELDLASSYGMLGSIDANTGDYLLGWDTDQFPMDFKATTLAMKIVVKQGGLQPGGLNFDAKLRRESSDIEDLFIGHIGGMDTFARGLRNVAKMIEAGDPLGSFIRERYEGFTNGIGKRIHEGKVSFEELEKHAIDQEEKALKEGIQPWPRQISGKQEKVEAILNDFV